MIIIMGGGVAGLAAGKYLSEHSRQVTVIEKHAEVGGLSRTLSKGGFSFDLGGHRLFTELPQELNFWRELMGDELLLLKRRSKIYYQGQVLTYPINPVEIFQQFDGKTLSLILAGYFKAKLHPFTPPPQNLEEWMIKRFGWKLYRMFFEDYSTKVWGWPPREIAGAWADERIQDFSLGVLISRLLKIPTRSGARTLAESFLYPRLGISSLAKKMAAAILARGGQIAAHKEIMKIHRDGRRIEAVSGMDANGKSWEFSGGHFISSLPLAELISFLSPPPPAEVLAAAKKLHYRDLIVVALGFDLAHLTDQQWLYVSDPTISFGRLHAPQQWSPELCPPGKSSLVCEWFAAREQPVWREKDEDLIARTLDDLKRLRLFPPLSASRLSAAHVERIRWAYPVYTLGYEEALQIVFTYLNSLENLSLAGRNGLHRYYNMEKSIESGWKAAARLTALPKD